MACATCEERAKLFKEAREAYNRGDMAEVERALKEVFGSVKIDISKLTAAIFKPMTNMKVGDRVSIFKELTGMDPHAERARHGGSGMLPDNHVHGPEAKRDPKVS